MFWFLLWELAGVIADPLPSVLAPPMGKGQG